MKRVILSISLLLLVAGCSRQSDEPSMFTGRIVSRDEVRRAMGDAVAPVSFGKAAFAVVNREWIEWHYAKFRAELSEGQFGIVKWDGRFTCTSFSTKFCADAQMRYFARAFHSTIQAQSIGLGEFWFDPGADGVGAGHALVVALVFDADAEAGFVVDFFEPQTGQWVKLTTDEQRSAFLRKFD